VWHLGRRRANCPRVRTRSTQADGVLGDHTERVVAPGRERDALVRPVAGQMRLGNAPEVRPKRRVVFDDELNDG